MHREVRAVVIEGLARERGPQDLRATRAGGPPVRAGAPTPMASSSVGTEPHPMPSSKRPPETWSSVMASLANCTGWRTESHSTRWFTVMVDVRAATHVAVVIAS